LKNLLISIATLLLVATGLHAQTTTYTGVIKDLSMNPVTFSFAGPFLQAADTIDAPTGFSQAGYSVGGYRGKGYQTQMIMISPAPKENHLVELAYVAKWIPIVNDKSFLMLPDELTYAQQAFAIAELLRTNDDSLSADYDTKGERHMTA
jgi:hypothetical protein